MEPLRCGGKLFLSAIRQNGISRTKWHRHSRCSYSSDNNTEKYKAFRDEDASEVLDVFEERLKITNAVVNNQYNTKTETNISEEKVDRLYVEEVVNLIKTNKGRDLAVLKLPPQLKYVDFLLITTGNSRRHIQGLGEIIRKYAKQRLNNINNVPQLEGSDSEWLALDLGNICIHIMSYPLREAYDIESLWGVGAKYDIKLHQQDEKILSLLKKHSYSSFNISNNYASGEQPTQAAN